MMAVPSIMVLSRYRVIIVFSHVLMTIPQNDALMSCKNTNVSAVTIRLSCSSSQWIHVRSETYGNTTLEQDCMYTTGSCYKTLMTDGQGLIVTCNGRQTCYEILQGYSTCTPVRSYKVIYDCIEDSLNVCSAQNKSTNGFVYLHSPGFPYSEGDNDSCTCRITGALMSVQLIEHRGRKKDLSISTDGNTLEQGVVPVNRIIVQRANHITLNYQGMDDGSFWIKVAGFGIIDVRCSNESTNMPSTSMATTASATTKESSSTGMVNVTFSNELSTASSDTTSSDTTTVGNRSKSSDTASSSVPASTITQSVTSTESNCDTDTPRTDDLNSTAIVGGVCGVIIFILIIDILLLLYFKVLKPSRSEAVKTAQVKEEFGNVDTNTSDSPYEPVTNSALDTSAPDSDEQISRDANNTYSGLSQYENQDGQHEYGKIHVYGNTRV